MENNRPELISHEEIEKDLDAALIPPRPFEQKTVKVWHYLLIMLVSFLTTFVTESVFHFDLLQALLASIITAGITSLLVIPSQIRWFLLKK